MTTAMTEDRAITMLWCHHRHIQHNADRLVLARFACRRGMKLRELESVVGGRGPLDRVLKFMGIHEQHVRYWRRMADLLGPCESGLDHDGIGEQLFGQVIEETRQYTSWLFSTAGLPIQGRFGSKIGGVL